MREHPVAQSSRASSVNLLARRIRHHNRDAAQAHESGYPAHGQPSPCQMPIERVAPCSPESRKGYCQGRKDAEDVPEQSGHVTFVYVAPDGVRLVLEDDADGVLRLAEILARVDTHERARRTVLLTRVSSLFRPLRIERSVLAQVAFDREQVINLRHGWRHLRLRETEPRSE